MEDWRRYYNDERAHGAIGSADHGAESRWRSQPAIVSKPKNSTPGDPKIGRSN